MEESEHLSEQERDQNLSDIMDELGVDSLTLGQLRAYLAKKQQQ